MSIADEKTSLTKAEAGSLQSGEEAHEEHHIAFPNPPAMKMAIFTTIPLFMGYAGMIVLQGKIKHVIGIKDGSHEAYLFGLGVGFLYLGNLIFRLMHNVIFTFLTPRHRVMLAYTCMTLATMFLAVPYFMVKTKSLLWVFIAYLTSGVAIGTFESNLMSSLTPLGHNTKSFAVIGIPIGFNSISIGAFLLFAASPDNLNLQMSVYLFIAAANLIGLVVYLKLIPDVEFEASKDTIWTFVKDLYTAKEWFPIIWKHCVALALDMFCVSLFSAVVLYIYEEDELPIVPFSKTVIPKNVFQTVYYMMSFVGDFVSRRAAYTDQERNPFIFIIFSLLGFGLVMSKTVLLAPFGMFFIMFANGSIYAQTTKYIDNHVERKYNLMALSVWLFVGDIGSFSGSQVTQPLRAVFGNVPQYGQGVAPAATEIANVPTVPPQTTTSGSS